MTTVPLPYTFEPSFVKIKGSPARFGRHLKRETHRERLPRGVHANSSITDLFLHPLHGKPEITCGFTRSLLLYFPQSPYLVYFPSHARTRRWRRRKKHNDESISRKNKISTRQKKRVPKIKKKKYPYRGFSFPTEWKTNTFAYVDGKSKGGAE